MRSRFDGVIITVLIIALVVAVSVAFDMVRRQPDLPEHPAGITVSDVRPLFERLGLEPPQTGDLIWPSMVRLLNELADRIERLEDGR